MVRITEMAVWFVLLGGSYFVFVSTVSPLEVAVGCTVAAFGAVTAALARRAERVSYRPAARWLRWLLPLPVAVVADAARLMLLLGRQLTGRRVVGQFVDLTLPDAPPERAEALRAAAMLLLSIPPGSYVVGFTPDGSGLRVHRLTTGTRMAEVVGR